VLAASCSTSTPAIPFPSIAEHAGPSPTQAPKPERLHGVAVIGNVVVANGDFRGNGRSQIAVLQDPLKNFALQITLREPKPDADGWNETTWLKSDPDYFALPRARFTVMDVDGDGKDDLVALYADSESRSRLMVFRSTGQSFAPAATWWSSDEYSWKRAPNVLSADLTGDGHESVLVTYQYDDAQMRIQSFTSTGSAFTFGGPQGIYDSGKGQFDLSRAKLIVGRFTRSGGAQQIAVLYQYPNAKMRLSVLDPSGGALSLQPGVFETNEGEYDLRQAALAAVDLSGRGRDDVVSAYTAADGSAKVHVFDASSGFRPTNGYAGVATIPPGSSCVGATALLAGDYDGDGKPDLAAVAPGDVPQVRTTLLRNGGGALKVTTTSEDALCLRWPLTGQPLGLASATRRPLYVKIDNNPSARPHYGIAKADQMYEWLVEGLTTRLAAVFQSQQPGVIGSVRSVRMTDLPIVPSLRGALVYSGGGPEELMALHYDDAVAHRYVDLAPGYGWGYRVEFRHAPYNYFTNIDLLRSAMAAAEANDPVTVPEWDFLPLTYKDPLAGGFADSTAATTITIPYRALFGVRYDYDANARTYTRFNDGVKEIDGATNEAIAARNIVVIQTEVHFTDAFGFDPAGNPKLDMVLTGTGKGIVFRDGRREEVTWTRPDIFDVFLLRNDKGDIVRLAPGQTWIQIVPKDWIIPSQ